MIRYLFSLAIVLLYENPVRVYVLFTDRAWYMAYGIWTLAVICICILATASCSQLLYVSILSSFDTLEYSFSLQIET
jgi:hypothetical protein